MWVLLPKPTANDTTHWPLTASVLNQWPCSVICHASGLPPNLLTSHSVIYLLVSSFTLPLEFPLWTSCPVNVWLCLLCPLQRPSTEYTTDPGPHFSGALQKFTAFFLSNLTDILLLGKINEGISPSMLNFTTMLLTSLLYLPSSWLWLTIC